MIEENYRYEDEYIFRELKCGELFGESKIYNYSDKTKQSSPFKDWWQSYLRGSMPIPIKKPSKPIKIIDLFCGCGGFTLGVKEAILGVGLDFKVLAAVDVDPNSLDIYNENFSPRLSICQNVNGLVDFQVRGDGEEAEFSYEPEIIDRNILKFRNNINLLIAGPPCQGHSNLNNYTRRVDPRNILYLGVVAIAVALKANSILIENVPAVINDKKNVVETAKHLLKKSGYNIDDHVLNAQDLGCAQIRRRHFLMASRHLPVKLQHITKYVEKRNFTVGWAINDLLDIKDSRGFFDKPSNLSEENVKRIEHLFKNNLYNLPNAARPDCHKDGHTYPSVYGRLKWSEPAQTITTGYDTPGRGRYIHPKKKRVITPHEAARLQGFPDFFKFFTEENVEPTRTALKKWIGEAVPPPLGYGVALCWLSSIKTN